MALLKEIHAYLETLGYLAEDIAYMDSSSVYVAQQIAMYAHQGQTRVNGENYFAHPYRVLQKYRKAVGIVEGDYFCLNEDLLVGECKVPYKGVQEVCLLHDVLEDSSLTVADVESVFEELSLGNFFRIYIKEPLLLLTRKDGEEYVTYLHKLLPSPTASLVKLMDFSDNMDISTLTVLGEGEMERLFDYTMYARLINEAWHFLENMYKYRSIMQQRKEGGNPFSEKSN